MQNPQFNSIKHRGTPQSISRTLRARTSPVEQDWPGQEKRKPQFAGGWAPLCSWAPLQTGTTDTMQCQRHACFLHLACGIQGPKSTSALVQGTWAFWHRVRGSFGQRLMGIWSPLIHTPHVKPMTMLSTETSHPYLTKHSSVSWAVSTNLEFT